jgi:hypothetical protein
MYTIIKIILPEFGVALKKDLAFSAKKYPNINVWILFLYITVLFIS